jgi:hypothetical protein
MYQMKPAARTVIVPLSLMNLNQSSIYTYDPFAPQYSPLDGESRKLNDVQRVNKAPPARVIKTLFHWHILKGP